MATHGHIGTGRYGRNPLDTRRRPKPRQSSPDTYIFRGMNAQAESAAPRKLLPYLEEPQPKVQKTKGDGNVGNGSYGANPYTETKTVPIPVATISDLKAQGK